MKQIFTMDVEEDIDTAVAFSKWLNKKGLQGEFYVTGELVSRYPSKVKEIGKYHILGGHGYKHEDFARLSRREVRRRVQKVLSVFRENGLKISGWRFPYLSYSNYAMNYVALLGLYDSSIRGNVWRSWGRLSFIRNWVRNLLRGIVTFPYMYSSRLKEKPWSHADLSDKKFYRRDGRLITHCYNYKKFEKVLL